VIHSEIAGRPINPIGTRISQNITPWYVVHCEVSQLSGVHRPMDQICQQNTTGGVEEQISY